MMSVSVKNQRNVLQIVYIILLGAFLLLTQACSTQPKGNSQSLAIHKTHATSPAKFHADFETQSLANWNYVLHPQGVEISNDHSFAGNYAAKIQVKGSPDYVWYNNPALNRSELQYLPQTVNEGGTTDISFAFMLPELFSHARHEFAYWESNKSYRQIMRFMIRANEIVFQSTIDKQSHWQYQKLTAGQWYQLRMRIEWSSKPQQGAISIWFDQQLVVDAQAITSLYADEGAFIQLGILRDLVSSPESIWIDEVIEH